MALGDILASLSVQLSLDSAAFEKGSRKAAKNTNDLGDKMERMGNRIGSATRGIVTAGVAVAGAFAVNMFKDAIEGSLEYASSLGETAQQLGVTTDALQVYRYAASQVGISQEAMDNGLAKLTRSIGVAASGAGPAAKAFGTLGINVRDAAGHLKTADTIMPELVAALSAIPDPAARAALEVALFGKSGQQLDTLLAGGVGQLNNLTNAARELGIVLSPEQIRKADDAADKFAAVKQVLSAQIAGIVADNADAILRLVNALASLAEKAIRAADAWAKFMGAQGVRNTQYAKVDAYIDKSGLSRGEKERARGMARQIVDKRTGFAGGVPYFPSLGKWGPKHDVIAPGSTKLTDATYKFTKFGYGLIPASEGLAAISEGMDKVEKQADPLKEAFQDTANGIVDAVDRMASAFRGGGFLNILASVIGLGLKLGGTGLFGKGIAAKINANVPGFANGTSSAPGGLALVGERGPELVNLRRGSQVIPNHRLRGAGGPITVHVDARDAVLTSAVRGWVAEGVAVAIDGGARAGMARSSYRNSRRVG